MDKVELESQISEVVSDDWQSVKQITAALNLDVSSHRVRNRLDSMVVYNDLDRKVERYRGHDINYYRKAVKS